MYHHIGLLFTKVKYKLCYGKKIVWGKDIYLRSNFKLIIENKGKVIIGNNCFFNNYCSITSLNSVKIGKDSIFGEGVKIYDHNHKFNNYNVKISEQGYNVGSVYVGNNCWIGSNAVLLKNAKIGDNCVIGAGCIISTTIPNNSIVTGNRNLKVTPIIFNHSRE